MYVIKRDQTRQLLDEGKLRSSIAKHSYGLDTTFVNVDDVVQKVSSGMYDGVPVATLENLVAETIAYLSVKHPDYTILAGRYRVAILHKQTKGSFSEVVEILYKYIHPRTKLASPLISKEVY